MMTTTRPLISDLAAVLRQIVIYQVEDGDGTIFFNFAGRQIGAFMLIRLTHTNAETHQM